MQTGVFHRVGGPVDGSVEFLAFARGELAKHVIDHAAVLAGGTDSHPQARDRARAEMLDHRLHPVLAARTAFLTQAKVSKRQGQIVINHEDLGRGYLVKLAVRTDRATAEVHERLRLEQRQAIRSAAPECLPAAGKAQAQPRPRGQPVDDQKPDVVPRVLVLAARVAQPGHQANGGNDG